MHMSTMTLLIAARKCLVHTMLAKANPRERCATAMMTAMMTAMTVMNNSNQESSGISARGL